MPRQPLRCFPLWALLLLAVPLNARAQEAVEGPRVILASVPFTVTVNGAEGVSSLVEVRDARGTLLGSGPVGAGDVREFRNISIDSREALPIEVRIGDTVQEISPPFAPAWFSILPPLIAIVLALIFKEVITALLAGIWLGALVVVGYNPVQATWRVVDQYVVPALGDTEGGHTQIVIFSMLLGGMVGMISRNGGTMGVVRAVAPLARNRRRGKIATALAGLAIFFDDYANTLVVGNTMRPITDRLQVSREKLAYLVDSTAAPVAALVPVSTWVGYEVSLIGGGLTAAAGEATGADAGFLAGLSPYSVFIESIPYLFYPLLALSFVFLTSFMNRGLRGDGPGRGESGGPARACTAKARCSLRTPPRALWTPRKERRSGGGTPEYRCSPSYSWSWAGCTRRARRWRGPGRGPEGHLRLRRPLQHPPLGLARRMPGRGGPFDRPAPADRPRMRRRMGRRREGDDDRHGDPDAGVVAGRGHQGHRARPRTCPSC